MFVSSKEELDTEAPGVQRHPGRAATQEKGCQGPQRPEPGALQEQSPPPAAFRPGEQPAPGTHTRQEEEETPEQETHNGEFNIKFIFLLIVSNVAEYYVVVKSCGTYGYSVFTPCLSV